MTRQKTYFDGLKQILHILLELRDLDTKKNSFQVYFDHYLEPMLITHFESSLQNFLSFGSSHSAMYSNLFISSNAKGPDSVACFKIQEMS